MPTTASHIEPLVSCSQIRAARALLGWTQRDLGKSLGVDQRQIRFWERRIPLNKSKRQRIVDVFASHGVEFLAPPKIGVRKTSDA